MLRREHPPQASHCPATQEDRVAHGGEHSSQDSRKLPDCPCSCQTKSSPFRVASLWLLNSPTAIPANTDTIFYITLPQNESMQVSPLGLCTSADAPQSGMISRTLSHSQHILEWDSVSVRQHSRPPAGHLVNTVEQISRSLS